MKKYIVKYTWNGNERTSAEKTLDEAKDYAVNMLNIQVGTLKHPTKSSIRYAGISIVEA